ncbi:hypothetical protein RWU37_10750, partial [Enterococcus sp. 2CBP]
MAINNVIDLDAKLSLEKNIQIAGKKYTVVISDEIDQILTNLNIEIPAQLETMQERVEKIEDAGSEKYKKFVQKETVNMRDQSIETLDQILGKGEGNRIYQHYNCST